MTKREWMVWTAVLAPPLIALLSQGANFALAPWACALQWKPALYVVSAVALAIAAGSGALLYGEWQRVGRELPGEGGGAVARTRMLAVVGLLLSAFSFLVILWQAVAEIILGACE